MSTCQYFQICRVFPPNQKLDRWSDRQAADLVFRDTLFHACRAWSWSVVSEEINALPHVPPAQRAPDKVIGVAIVHTDANMSTHKQHTFRILSINYAHMGIIDISGMACWLGGEYNFVGLDDPIKWIFKIVGTARWRGRRHRSKNIYLRPSGTCLRPSQTVLFSWTENLELE